MKAVWSTLIGVTCLASSVLLGGCWDHPGPDGACPDLGDTIPTQQGDAVAGAAIFAANGCNTCHGEDGSGGFGPSIRSVQAETLAAKLQDPTVGHTGGLFPDLSAQNLADLAAFLGDGNVPPAPSGPLHSVDMKNTGILHAQGFSDPATNCVACHGSDLSGSPPAPSCFSCHGPLWSGGGPPPSHTEILSSGDVTGAHLPGRDTPAANCASCHQPDYFGTRLIPACWSCHGSIWDGSPDYPPTHTEEEHGFHHDPGLETPVNTCNACHGSDLTGTPLIPSCFSCHGDEWNDDDDR